MSTKVSQVGMFFAVVLQAALSQIYANYADPDGVLWLLPHLTVIHSS